LTPRFALGTLVSIMSPEHSAGRTTWQRPVATVLLVIATLLALSVAILSHAA
jgi:hypothetical protein